jgi:hypothetical protein
MSVFVVVPFFFFYGWLVSALGYERLTLSTKYN